MAKHANPKWILNDDWAISTDPYNWILYRLSGKRWRPVAYFRTPELLLESLYRKLTRTEPRQPTIELHVEHCLRVAQAAADRFIEGMATYPSDVLKTLPAAYRTTLKTWETVEAARAEIMGRLRSGGQQGG